MNAGFRNLLGWRDTTRFKAYVLAISVQMLLLPLLHYFGLVQLNAPAFYPFGAMLGGFLFGMAMNWGGGCAGGVWYKLGAGNIGALIAIIGVCLGYLAAEAGALQSLRLLVQSFGASEATTLNALFHQPLWRFAIPLALLLIFFLLKSSRTAPESGWSWIKTGVVVGSIGVIAWLASSLAGRNFGMAIMPGNKDLFEFLSYGKWQALSWDFFFVLGIPLGGFLSVYRAGKFASATLSGAAVWRLAAGGFVLGASASFAGGCTVGHGLTGIPLLALGSITFTLFALLGAWVGSYWQKKS